jgi:arylsulfatase A-like enzyme
MPSANRRPSLLILMTDQHRHDGLGCVNPTVRTPNLDALAGRGMRFSQAVCNVPMCVPSRYSMMTGLYGCQVGVKHNTQMLTRDDDLPVPVLAERLRSAGYQTAGIGKTHWYVGSRIMPGVEVEPSTRGFEVRALARSRGGGQDEPEATYMADEEPDLYERLGREMRRGGPGGESTPGYVGATSTFPAGQHREGWLTRKALDFLHTGRDPDRPFFLYLSFDAPHPPFFVPEAFESRYRIEDFADTAPPEPWPDTHAPGKLETRWPEMTAEQRRRSRLRYAAYCSYVDSLFGEVLDALEAAGELDNTFVLFTSDHGEMLGDRGRVSKYCLYEGSVRVPMILAGPGVERHGEVNDRPVELVDVLPTALAAVGEEAPEILPGVNLLSDFARTGSFAEMHGRGYEEYQRAPTVMWRTREWKLLLSIPGPLGAVGGRYDTLRGELYYLTEDPLELRNRYDDPACAAVRENMTGQLLMHVMCALGRFPSGPTRAGITITGPETKPDSSMWKRKT